MGLALTGIIVAQGRPTAASASTAMSTRPSAIPWESLPWQGSLAPTCNTLTSAGDVSFLPGWYEFVNFDANGYGGLFWLNVSGVHGSGVDSTYFQMHPWTSTKAGQVPTAQWSTNDMALMRVGGSDDGNKRLVSLSGFTLRGTDQGHLYNGFMFYDAADGSTMTDCRVHGIPGRDSVPPGETFGINVYRSNRVTLTRVEVDGRRPEDGTRVGAANVGVNYSSDFTMTDCYSHHTAYSHGVTCYEVKNVTLNRVRAEDCAAIGLNLERVSGVVNINGSTMLRCGWSHITVDSDRASAKVTITDPIFDGPKLRVTVHASGYAGNPQKQLVSDIRLVVGGVSRPDLLQILT